MVGTVAAVRPKFGSSPEAAMFSLTSSSSSSSLSSLPGAVGIDGRGKDDDSDRPSLGSRAVAANERMRRGLPPSKGLRALCCDCCC